MAYTYSSTGYSSCYARVQRQVSTVQFGDGSNSAEANSTPIVTMRKREPGSVTWLAKALPPYLLATPQWCEYEPWVANGD